MTRLVRAALNHEVAQVQLNEGPARPQPHTLDLRVTGSPPVSLLAEPAGKPQNGHFPLRLRPQNRAHAAELFAMLEAENAPSVDIPPTPSPDTIAQERPPISDGEVAAPILRAMSGSAPPPVTEVALSESEVAVPANLPIDPKRTAPSASWNQPTQSRQPPVSSAWSQPPPAAHDDPRRTRPSAAWAERLGVPPTAAARQAPAPTDDESPADAEGPSLSVSVVFEPEARAALEVQVDEDEEDDESPADAEGPSLSVSVVFEPESNPAVTEEPSIDVSISSEPIVPPAVAAAAAAAAAPAEADSFFDADFANLALAVPDEEPASARSPDLALDEPAPEEGAAGAPIPPPEDDDDDFDTLIRLPGGPPARASVRPAAAPPPERVAIVSPEARKKEEFTPTQTLSPAQRKSSGTGTGTGGRKKKTTRRGKAPDRKKKPTGHSDEWSPETVEGDSIAHAEASTSSRKPKPETDPLLGRKVADGKYVIETAIGSGAAGAVYKATHRELRRTVAIKVLHPHYQQDPHFMKGFRGEALAASQLDHPNVMRVLDFGQEPDGLVYIVMEYLSGRTLQSLLDEERRLAPDRAVEIMIQVCAALSVAHDNGIIHRDIKPDNIMLVPSRNDEGGAFDLVKVCDFGIAALENPRAEDAELGIAEGVIAGTPEYMSPEQARGIEIDARADVYACGICLYELVTGRPPFLGENPADILIKQLDEAPRPPSQLVKGLDPILEEMILRSIQKDPGKRQQSARELRVELKELIDPGDSGDDDDDDERSIVESVPGLDDPASGFPGFFLLLSSAVLRFGRFERGHPEASQAMKDLLRATKAALRGRGELTFARRDTAKAIGFCVMSGYAEIVDMRRLLGSQLYGSHGVPLIEELVKKGVAAMTLREGLPDQELQYAIEMLLGPLTDDELRKEFLSKPLRFVSVVFVSDVVGRDRKLTWKVGLCTARLARDLKALSNIRGISLKKMREIREDLVGGIARLLTKGDEVRHFLFNADLIDDAVANLRGFSAFQTTPLMVEKLLHEPCAEAAVLLLNDFDEGKISREVLRGYLRLFAMRLLTERSPKSDAAVTALYNRHIVTDDDLPRDLREQIRAEALADALVRESSQFLRMLDMIGDPEEYARELGTLEAAMAVLARKAEAGALLAAISVLARHAKGSGGKPGQRESHALRTMKSIIDKQRLVPIANTLLVGPPHQREAARHLLVLAGSAGAHSLYIARESLYDPAARPTFVQVFRETGAAGWSILTAVLSRMEPADENAIALVEDLLRCMPDRQDPVLGEAVARFLAHPRLRPTALAAIVPLWGERARKALLEALEFAEEPARIVAIQELRRLRAVDDHVVGIIERLLTMRGTASEELRAAAASALADVGVALRVRALGLLTKGVEGKRGFVALLRGDGGSEESVIVTEAMARALLALDRNEGVRAIKERLKKADGMMRARLGALVQA
jgi:serine/threonine protein kinase